MKVIQLESVDSTNAYAKLLLETEHKSPFWIAAERQTNGRGRYQRKWISDKGNLFCSRVYSVGNDLEHASNLSFVAALAVAETLLKFVGLHQKRKLRAGDLSFGQQKLLELAMALMNEPKMLLLDEPTAGINPTLINGIIDRLISVNKDYGITLLVIEHNMKVIMNLAQRVFCLAHGQMLANGTPDEIKNDKRVLDAYLGAQ